MYEEQEKNENKTNLQYFHTVHVDSSCKQRIAFTEQETKHSRL